MSVLRCALLTAALLVGAPFGAARAQTPDSLALPADTLSFDPFADSLAQPSAPPAVVTGRVTAGGVPVGGAAVLVPGTLAATVTDSAGVFVLVVDFDGELDGDFDGSMGTATPTADTRVEVRFAGYRPWQRRLALAPGDTVRVEVALDRLPFWARLRVFGERLRFGTSAREAFGTARRVEAEPGPDESESSAPPPVRLDAPARTLAALASLAPSVVRDDRTDSLDVRALGTPRLSLDGVLLPRGATLPFGLVESVEVRPGALSAGDAAGRGGVLAVASRRGDGAPALRIDARGAGVTGRGAGLPSAGTADIGGRAEGSFVRGRLRLVVGLRTARTDDPSPSARALPRLTDAALARLRATPQLLRIDDGTATGRLIALPVAAPGATLASALPPGTRFPAGTQPRLIDAWQGLTDADLTASPLRRGADARRDESFVRAGLALPFGIGLDLLRAAVTDDIAVPTATASLFAPGDARARETSRHTRTRLDTRRFGTDIALTLARTTLARTSFRDGYGRDVRAAFGYADIDDPRNATAAAYRMLPFTTPAGDPLDPASYTATSMYSDRSLPSYLGAADLFVLPGALTTGYARRDGATTVVRLDLGRRVRARGSDGHRLGAGVEHEQTTERAFVLPIAALRLLAQRAADGNVDFGGPGYARYDDVPYEVFAFQTAFVGYRYNGLARNNTGGDVDDVVAAIACAAPCANGPDEAPARASRTGAWVSDRLTAGPLAVDAGLRLDVFARGGVAFYDPYATLPVVRAGDVGLARGPIRADWVPYYSGDVAVTGYRDRAGRFYNGVGEPVLPNEVITNISVKPRLADGVQFANGTLLPDARSLRRPKTHLAWQPRIAASLALGADASLFASLASTAEAASPLDAHLSVMRVLIVTQGASTTPNPDLAPIRATTGGVGGRIGAGRLAVSLDLWGRRESGLPELVLRRNVFPSNYQTHTSTGSARHIGADVAAEIAAGPRVRLQTSYSVMHTFATPLDPGTTLTWRIPGYGDVRRHRVLMRLRAHTAPHAGPAVAGRHPLGGWAVDAVVDAASGTPYTAARVPFDIGSTRPLPYGGVGMTPWTQRLDLGLARTLARVGGGRVALTARGENVLGRRNVRRVWAATGKPDTDGFLGTADGAQQYPSGSPAERLYRIRLVDPMAYGRAREITVGLRWTR